MIDIDTALACQRSVTGPVQVTVNNVCPSRLLRRVVYIGLYTDRSNTSQGVSRQSKCLCTNTLKTKEVRDFTFVCTVRVLVRWRWEARTAWLSSQYHHHFPLRDITKCRASSGEAINNSFIIASLWSDPVGAQIHNLPIEQLLSSVQTQGYLD